MSRIGSLFFQAEDGIRYLVRSRGLGDVYKRQEITGPAFSPDGSRLYFSSQRGKTGRNEDGITFEITGPF